MSIGSSPAHIRMIMSIDSATRAAGFARVRPEDLHVGRDRSRSETDIEPAVRHVIQKRQPPRDVGRMVVLQADRRRSDANALRQPEHFRQEDLRHDDVLDARRMVLADPEIVEAQLLALHGQLEVLVDALGQRLGRIVDRHDEHTESQWLSVTHSFTFRIEESVDVDAQSLRRVPAWTRAWPRSTGMPVF